MLCGIYVSATFAVSHSLVITLAYYYGDNVELSPVFHSAFCLLSSYSSDVRAEQSARFLLHGGPCMENVFFNSLVVVCGFFNPTPVKATTLAYFRN